MRIAGRSLAGLKRCRNESDHRYGIIHLDPDGPWTPGRLSTNPRYFEVRDGDERRAVYLTGAHVNNNFHDGMGPGAECPDEPDGSTSTPTSVG